ncbi:hypothetical protein JCM14036_34570 [Desulfotomaculum defluvii]
MESMGFNATLLAQMFNFLILILLFVTLSVVIIKVVRRTGRVNPENSRLEKIEEDIQDIKKNMQNIAKKLDQKQ